MPPPAHALCPFCRLDSRSSPIARGDGSVLKQGRGDTSHQSPRTPMGMGGCGLCTVGTCRIFLLGAVIFLSHNDRAPGLIAPPLSRSSSVPVVLPRCLSEGCLLHDWCSNPHKRPPPPPPHGPGLSPFISKRCAPALKEPRPSAHGLLHCLASEKDYYFNSIYCE